MMGTFLYDMLLNKLWRYEMAHYLIIEKILFYSPTVYLSSRYGWSKVNKVWAVHWIKISSRTMTERSYNAFDWMLKRQICFTIYKYVCHNLFWSTFFPSPIFNFKKYMYNINVFFLLFFILFFYLNLKHKNMYNF